MKNKTAKTRSLRYFQHARRTDTSAQAGIGLVEIMVAMAIGVFMLGGILSLVLWVSRTRVDLDKTSEQIENGRYAIQLISNELRLGGFYGMSQIGTTASSMPTPCPTTAGELGFSYDSTTLTTTLPVAIQGVSSLPQADTTCFSNYKSGSEAIVVRHVETESVAMASAGMPYVQMSACQEDSMPMDFGVSGTATFSLRQKSCSLPAVLWPYTIRAFYLGACDICSPNDNMPTLKMAELRVSGGGIQVVGQSVVEGIEDMHFQYGMDLDTDGSPDCYVPDPAVDVPPAASNCPAGGWSDIDATNWSNVVSVRINLLARSTEASNDWKDDRTYDLGRGTPVGPFNDKFRRQIYSTVVTLPNISGVRE